MKICKTAGMLFFFTYAGMISAQRSSPVDDHGQCKAFDFGPANSVVTEAWTAVCESTLYSERKGYGLCTRNGRGYISDIAQLQDEWTVDGVESDSSVQFKTKIEPGRYWVRLVIGGGRFSTWKGQIDINDRSVSADLEPYRMSAENEQPPPYWTVFERVTIREPMVMIRIAAQNQPSTLNAVQIFPDRFGPLYLEAGLLKANTALRTPNSSMILRLLNSGDVQEAQTLIEVIPEDRFGFEKAIWLMALAGRLEIEQPRPLLEWSRRLLQEEQRQDPPAVALNLHLLDSYLQADTFYKMAGWDWARHYSGAGIFIRQDVAARLWDEIGQCQDHPLRLRALWQVGKLCFNAWLEEHVPWLLSRANACFAELKTWYPQHTALRIYSGEKVCPEKIKATKASAVPAWVRETLTAKEAVRDLSHYWVSKRQSDAGEFGGKYDDDVEMLRWWPLLRLAMNDSLALLGYQRLVNGIWNSSWIEKGFSRNVNDVEHASEPVADTQPIMIGLEYGNPVYVERCMQTAKGIRDVWTGINGQGHRHFKTSWYSATNLDERPPRDCDVPMNTRTVQALRWLAWYTHHPFAMQFMREWGDAWLDDCRRTDRGKPYGIVPSAIRYHDDAIGGHGSTWYNPDMFWRYYDFSGGHLMLLQFLATYDLTGEDKYLEPVEIAIRLLAKYGRQNLDSARAGSEAWVVNKLRQAKATGEVLQVWRLLSGNKNYDYLLQTFGSEYDKFLLSRDTSHLETTSRSMTEALRCQGELLTREGYFTDRIGIVDLHTGKNYDTAHLESIYTGASLNKAFYPFYAVTWPQLDRHCLAVVLAALSDKLEVLIWNAASSTLSAEMAMWRLSPGLYRFEQGRDHNNDWQMDGTDTTHTITICDKPSICRIMLPGGSASLIRLEKIKDKPSAWDWSRPDLALAREEITRVDHAETGEVTFTVPVHNIGNREARNISVALSIQDGRGIKALTQKTIKVLEPPLDLTARIAVAELKIPAAAAAGKTITIAIDPKNRIDEINEKNNAVVMILTETVH